MKNVILVLVMTLLMASGAMADNIFPLPTGNVGIGRGMGYHNPGYQSMCPLTVSNPTYYKTYTSEGEIAFFGSRDDRYYKPFGLLLKIRGTPTTGDDAADLANRRMMLQTTEHGFANDGMLILQLAGKVGIGEKFGYWQYLVPAEKLEVDGNVKADGFIGDGSALTGIVHPAPDLSGIEARLDAIEDALDDLPSGHTTQDRNNDGNTWN